MKQIKAERQAKLEAQRKAREAREQQSVQSSVQSSGSGSADTQSTGSSQSRKSIPASAGVSGTSTGKRVANYALQFVGNPYRYGGNSLTNGIDCSGFTQQVLAKFGYSISRTSSSQASEGVAVSTSNLRAGDLIFYGSGGGINHVAFISAADRLCTQVIQLLIQKEGSKSQMRSIGLLYVQEGSSSNKRISKIKIPETSVSGIFRFIKKV